MRKYFLGANTPKGFYSYYDYLISQEDARKIYIIKGGPGTGKSTLMKKIGAWAEENGFETDYIHCSSDPDSLDGLVIPEMKVAMVDGTSPHIVDPKTPGAVDTIVNLCDCWNEKNMIKNKDEILSINKKIADKYKIAYSYLKSAGIFHKTIRSLATKAVSKDGKFKACDEIGYSEIKDFSSFGKSRKRKLFASAFGPKGYISHAKTLFSQKKYIIRGNGSELLTEKLAMEISRYGYDTELYFNPLAPDGEISHIIVPELSVGIFTEEYAGGISRGKGEIIDLSALSDKYVLDEYSSEIDFCKRELMVQTEEACNVILQAKTLHDSLEGYYIPNMDFARMGRIEEKIIEYLEDIK